MPLPILQTNAPPGPADLVRLFHRTELHWARHLGEEVTLGAGTAIANPELPNVWDANRVLDAALPAGTSPADAVWEADDHFAAQGCRCAQLTLNPSVPAERTAPLIAHLKESGWSAGQTDILYLAGAPSRVVREVPGLTIIPARAGFRHYRVLGDEAATRWDEPQLAEAWMLHLDDPHYDSLLALKGGEAVGTVGVLAVGDVGRIEPLYVARAFRRQGAGRTLMSRALESCARSLFRHVMLGVFPGNGPAQALYAQLGFRKIGEMTSWSAPWTAARTS